MEHRHLGRSGLTVSRIGLGTMTWGGETDSHEAAEQLKAFLDAGGSLVDTAPLHGEGVAEEVLGALLAKDVRREDVVVATKAGLQRRGARTVADTSRRALLDTLDATLARLDTDHVDLWQVHVFSGGTPMEETLSALDYAVATGRARYVGVSNFSGWQLARAVTMQERSPAYAAVVSDQIEYSLLERRAEREILPAAEALEVGVLAWSPLGRGVLTGKYRHGTPSDSRGASSRYSSFVESFLDAPSRRIVDALATAADGLGRSPLEVALAWVRDRPGVSAAVVGARTAAQLRASLAADSVTLPAEIAQALDDVSLSARDRP